jgi:hypothetical protein
MQDCFREHPDVYGDEIDDDDEEDNVVPEETSPAASSPYEQGDASWFSSWFS